MLRLGFSMRALSIYEATDLTQQTTVRDGMDGIVTRSATDLFQQSNSPYFGELASAVQL
jgi:hypothetical protein